jgi:hypothetical protein
MKCNSTPAANLPPAEEVQTRLGPLLLPREDGVMRQPFKYLLLSLGVSAGHVVEGPAGDA